MPEVLSLWRFFRLLTPEEFFEFEPDWFRLRD